MPCTVQQHRIHAKRYHFPLSIPMNFYRITSHKIQGSQTSINACWFLMPKIFATNKVHICNCWCYGCRCCCHRCHLNFQWNKFHLVRSPFLNNINMKLLCGWFSFVVYRITWNNFSPTTNFPFFHSFFRSNRCRCGCCSWQWQKRAQRKSKRKNRNKISTTDLIKITSSRSLTFSIFFLYKYSWIVRVFSEHCFSQ